MSVNFGNGGGLNPYNPKSVKERKTDNKLTEPGKNSDGTMVSPQDKFDPKSENRAGIKPDVNERDNPHRYDDSIVGQNGLTIDKDGHLTSPPPKFDRDPKGRTSFNA